MAKNTELGAALRSLKLTQPFNLQNKVHSRIPENLQSNSVDRTQTNAAELSQKELPKSEKPRLEATQNQAPSEKLPILKAAPREKIDPPENLDGFFKIPHSIFYDQELRELSGDSFRLLIWLCSRAWRFPDSDGTLRASVSFIKNGTGIGHAAISRSLKILQEKNFIELREQNFKHGNLWKLKNLNGGSGSKKLAPNEPPQIKQPAIQGVGSSKQEGSSLEMRVEPPRIEAQPRNSINTRTERISLADENMPEKISKYFESGLAPRKRDSEMKFYFELKNQYQEGEIELCYEYVTESCTSREASPIHSPMAYLSKAIADVLPLAAKAKEAQQQRKENEILRIKRKLEFETKERAREEKFENLELSFKNYFSDQGAETAYVKSFAKLYPELNPQGSFLRAAAVSNWVKTQQNSEVQIREAS
jgi:hypothetical protein